MDALPRTFVESFLIMPTASAKPKATAFQATSDELDKLEHETSDELAKIRKGKSRAKNDTKLTATTVQGDTAQDSVGAFLDGVEIVDETLVPLASIQRSALNPRSSFDETLIAEMATNIATICNLNPLTVREGTYELIDGETRHRAAEVAGVAELRCKIVRCTDAQAACIRLQSSMQRRDLNPIEKARALKALQETHGFSQRQLSPIVKLQQGSIANLTRLLELPIEWQERVISGEITASTARELVPYAGEAAVLNELAENLKAWLPDERNAEISRELVNAVICNSRPLAGSHFENHGRYRHIGWKPTEEQAKALRIFKCNHSGEREQKRCLNVALWEDLQTAWEAKEAAKKTAKADKVDTATSKKAVAEIDPDRLAEQQKRQAEIFAKKLYRYRTEWYQAQVIDQVKTFDESDCLRYAMVLACVEGWHERNELLCSTIKPGYKGTPQKVLHELPTLLGGVKCVSIGIDTIKTALVRWLAGRIDGLHPAITPEAFESIAVLEGIEIAESWPETCKQDDMPVDWFGEYLNLLSKDQLIDLIAEWKLSLKFGASTKRSDLIAEIAAAGRGKPVPKALLKAKAVSLI
jgi:ParB/RepB/Spo0J family partition protein